MTIAPLVSKTSCSVVRIIPTLDRFSLSVVVTLLTCLVCDIPTAKSQQYRDWDHDALIQYFNRYDVYAADFSQTREWFEDDFLKRLAFNLPPESTSSDGFSINIPDLRRQALKQICYTRLEITSANGRHKVGFTDNLGDGQGFDFWVGKQGNEIDRRRSWLAIRLTAIVWYPNAKNKVTLSEASSWCRERQYAIGKSAPFGHWERPKGPTHGIQLRPVGIFDAEMIRPPITTIPGTTRP